jgi:CRP/FNR family cyclic AMP-dependent transcriptional regulator
VADEIIAALQSSELFGGLTPKRLKAIRDAGREVSFDAGSELVVEGDDAGRFYLILEGSAKVQAHGGQLATLKAGDAVGEIALIDGGRRSATVTATSALRAFSLASWNFTPFMNEPDVMHAVVALLCRRLRQAQSLPVARRRLEGDSSEHGATLDPGATTVGG